MTGHNLSVVIPTHNRPELLRRAVASVLVALPEGAEILVVDDASDLPADQVLGDLVRAGASLRIIRNRASLGPAGARNSGVRAAQGRIVLFLDDDDLLRRGYPEAVLFAARANDGPRWGFSPILTHLDPATTLPEGRVDVGGTLLAGPGTRKHLGGLGCGFWIERGLFLEAGGLNGRLRVNEDTDLCLRLMGLGHWPWRGTLAGVSVLQRNSGKTGAPSVTRKTGAAERAECFRAIRSSNAEFLAQAPLLRKFLLRRQLKMLARAGCGREALAIIRAEGNAVDLALLTGFLVAERFR